MKKILFAVLIPMLFTGVFMSCSEDDDKSDSSQDSGSWSYGHASAGPDYNSSLGGYTYETYIKLIGDTSKIVYSYLDEFGYDCDFYDKEIRLRIRTSESDQIKLFSPNAGESEDGYTVTTTLFDYEIPADGYSDFYDVELPLNKAAAFIKYEGYYHQYDEVVSGSVSITRNGFCDYVVTVSCKCESGNEFVITYKGDLGEPDGGILHEAEY